jgi:hypothetical protein
MYGSSGLEKTKTGIQTATGCFSTISKLKCSCLNIAPYIGTTIFSYCHFVTDVLRKAYFLLIGLYTLGYIVGTRHVHKVSFSLVPQLANLILREATAHT